jgi:DNA-directed RNA polymerase specialized sigma24 family protein
MLIQLMDVSRGEQPDLARFDEFVRAVEPSLLQALVSTYGPVDGREATVDALSWAWEHWDRLAEVSNKVGYLYRVGQTAVRSFAGRHLELVKDPIASDGIEVFDPALVPALRGLSEQQRTAVVLVYGFQWSQTEVANLLDVTPSTVREHLRRALDRLREQLEVPDAC